MKIFHLLTHTINAPKNESEGCKMEEDRYKRPDDDNQTISTPRAEDPIPGTFQVIDELFRQLMPKLKVDPRLKQNMITVKKQLQNLLHHKRIV